MVGEKMMIKRSYSLKRTMFLYYRLMSQNYKALIGYHADFIIMLVSSAITQLLGIIFLWVVYQRIPNIQGWKFWEVAFIYAMVFLTEGFASFFFEGCWSISLLVNQGELDRLLLRPISPVLQILASKIGINGISNIIIGGIIISQALRNVKVNWTVSKVAMFTILMLSAIIIRVSINFASNNLVFWTQHPGNSFSFMVHSISDFAKYPISIYNYVLQAFITVVVPYAFISFYPAVYIFDKGSLGYVGLIAPFIAGYCLYMSIFIFHLGLKRYESAGN